MCNRLALVRLFFKQKMDASLSDSFDVVTDVSLARKTQSPVTFFFYNVNLVNVALLVRGCKSRNKHVRFACLA